jgi:superfamily II DNA or RNA helicase
MDRQEIQSKALELSKSHKHVLLEFPTGLGKSKAAIDIVKYHGEEWLLVCKEINHIDNWRAEFQKHGHSDLWDEKVVAICYASLHKYIDTDFNLILDEVHAAGSDLRIEYLKSINSNKIVSLSATVDDDIKKKLKEICEFEDYKIDMADAVEWGILPEPEINIIYVDLDDTSKINKWKPHKNSHSKNLTDKEYYEQLSRNIDYWHNQYKKDYQEWKKIKMLREALKRKTFISKAKTEATKDILTKLKGKRFICFSGSIDQCEELGGEFTIHSKIDKNTRQQRINSFNKLEIDEVYAVDMLQESMNLNQIDAGIIVQLDKGERTAIQMIGRVLRSIAPQIYILVARDTQDEQYMKSSLKNIDSKYINYI